MESGTMKGREMDRVAGVQFKLLPVRILIHLFSLKKKVNHDSSLKPVLRTVDAAWCNRYVAKSWKSCKKVAKEATTNDHHHEIVD
jgi:hypothetical protein